MTTSWSSKKGGISERGTHAELLRQRGHYYKPYTQQFRQERAVAYEGLFGELAMVTAWDAPSPAEFSGTLQG